MVNKNEKKIFLSIYLLIVLNCISILVYNYFLLNNLYIEKLKGLRRYNHAIAIIGTIIFSLAILSLLWILIDNSGKKKFDNMIIVLIIIFLLIISAGPLYINKLVKQCKKVKKPIIISYSIAIILIIILITYVLISLLKQ